MSNCVLITDDSYVVQDVQMIVETRATAHHKIYDDIFCIIFFLNIHSEHVKNAVCTSCTTGVSLPGLIAFECLGSHL